MSPKASAKYILRLNTRKVLKLIRENPSISRAQISKISGLSAPTISIMVDDGPVYPSLMWIHSDTYLTLMCH
jgi:hypothetical protein